MQENRRTGSRLPRTVLALLLGIALPAADRTAASEPLPFSASEPPVSGDCGDYVKGKQRGAFRFCWEENADAHGEAQMSTMPGPLVVEFTGKYLVVPEVSSAVQLFMDHRIALSDEEQPWTHAQAHALYQTLKRIPIGHPDSAMPPRLATSKWVLTRDHVPNDVEFYVTANGETVVRVSAAAFANASARIARFEGSRAAFFSNRLHRVLVRFVTDEGRDEKRAAQILEQRFGLRLAVPDYQGLTGENASHFQPFHAAELVELINVLENMPEGFHQVPGLNYVVRRLDGTCHPRRACGVPAIAYPQRGYIEFMEKAFVFGMAGITHRRILHEKAHFLWDRVFSAGLKDDWVRLSGWHACAARSSGWCTRSQTEYASAYAHALNPNEDMAESLAYFTVNPERLRSRAPDKYAFIRERVMHGNAYLSKIRDDLTFEVYNLAPDYVFPGKIRRIRIAVDGAPGEDKRLTVEMAIHGKAQEQAAWARLRLSSEAGTYFDLQLKPADGWSSGTTLRGQKTISKYARSGYWTSSNITLSDAAGNQRMSGANDFGWALYVDNPLEDRNQPAYRPGTATLTRYEERKGGESINVVEARWAYQDEHMQGSNACYAKLDDSSPETYSLEHYGEAAAGNCQVRFELPHNLPSGRYSLSQISMTDLARNQTRVIFAGGPGEERPPSVVLSSERPDTRAPQLDLNTISIDAEPLDPLSPDGETLVTLRFQVNEDLSGYRMGSFRLRDPRGTEQLHYHYPAKSPPFMPDPDKPDWLQYEATVVLPRGSAPGKWGLTELTLQDQARNFATHDFTEIIPVMLLDQ
jgi:hypothetical protein